MSDEDEKGSILTLELTLNDEGGIDVHLNALDKIDPELGAEVPVVFGSVLDEIMSHWGFIRLEEDYATNVEPESVSEPTA